MSAHVPAWKRLGLKLKGPASGEALPSQAGPNARAKPAAQVPNAHQARVNGSPASALKRKLPSSASTNAASATPNKKPRRGDQSAADQGTPSSLRKSVSFADDTKASAKDKPEKKKAKKKKATKASDAPKADFSLEPSLNYIRQWHTARASWKFNKNHQTLLIKYLFDGDKVPSADIPIFYQYIRDLKGFVRTRLRETAAEIKQKDMDAGAGAFPAALKDKETKQKEYEETISRFLQDLHQHQQRRREPSGSAASSKNANGKRTLDEVEYVLRIATPEIKQRLLKRIRAELVVDELSDSEESTTATATSTSSSSSASTTAAAVDGTTATTAATGRSDGSQQPAKRRRLRNVRTDIGDDDSSSSESESEESESEESSSESDESDDEAMDVDVAPDGAAAAESSSSSSSSSEAESGSEEEEDDDDDESGSESSSSDED